MRIFPRLHDYAIMTMVMDEKLLPAGEFKATCLKVLDEVQHQRKQVVITKRGKPVAKLVPMDENPESFIGSMQGTMEIVGDIMAPLNVKWEANS
jgi:prevent-host-death family protein